MKLSIVTIVFNDLNGLKKTSESVIPLLSNQVEWWVIDGSSNNEVKQYLGSHPHPQLNWISEKDNGIYDAMNKSLKLVIGNYVIFMNAGDMFYAGFSPMAMLEKSNAKGETILGYSIETFGSDKYLRPGVGREIKSFTSPSHQATFYPRAFYTKERYDLRLPVGADGDYTAKAIKSQGATFIPVIVCEFELGGTSSNYSCPRTVIKRIIEDRSIKSFVLLSTKFLLWKLLSQRLFYRLLSVGRYTRITEGAPLPLPTQPLSRIQQH